jgi:tRNA dimethylallyltransferase
MTMTGGSLRSAGRVVVLGSTASGKSDVAMALAASGRIGPVEVVAVDAMQVYRGMDIGTAKPTLADRAAVPHHGLDLVEPSDEFTVAEFVRAAEQALDEIAARGARAIMVGGTGLYLRALTDPMEIPGRWPEVRAALEARLLIEPVAVLHAELEVLDPVAAARMDPGNARRVVRALEVCLGGGRRFSSYGPGLDAYPPIETTQVGLRWPRPLLAARIERRVHQMMSAGLLAEVEALAERLPGWSRTARQALGYKELLDHLDGLSSLDEAIEVIIRRTRQFAVRQERWFRRDPRIQWLELHDDPVAEVVPVVEQLVTV